MGSGRRYLLVRDDDAPWPDGPPLELRSEGLWAAATCETPLAHWGIGLEAFAVAFDDPLEAWGREWGDRVALGFDLEWEDEGGQPCRWDDGYVRWGSVHGEVLVGEHAEVETIDVDAVGVRRHVWGMPRATSWAWSWRADGGFTVEEHAESLPRGTDGLALTDGRLTPVHHAPLLDPPDRVSRALGTSPDGAVGWLESRYPPPADGYQRA